MVSDDSNSFSSTRRLPDSGSGDVKILVVDDDAFVRKFLEDVLSPKYKVVTTETCKDALKHIKSDFFNVAIVDVNLPDMSGKEFLKSCKGSFLETQIIIITGAPEYEDAVNMIKDGAFDYVTKPLEIHALMRKIEEAVEHGRKKANRKLKDSDYKIIRRLGTGSMGIVLLVEKSGSKYAMKILRKDEDPFTHMNQISRFKREAKILSEIENPGVVRIFDYEFDKESETHFIVMEYVEGKPLSSHISDKSLGLAQKIGIIRQIADILHDVHKAGILHRDIKPENILVKSDLSVKITDFGISRVVGSSLTMTKDLIGSPLYMSPESFDSMKSLDERSDLFSLGILSYELLTGAKAFDGKNVFQVMDSIKNDNPVQPSKINPEIPSWLEDMMAKMLAKKPADRFSSAEEISKCIRHYMEEPTASSLTITSKILRSMLFIKRNWS